MTHQLVFNDSFFYPFKVEQNNLTFDFAAPLESQEAGYREDELFVRFSGNRCLDIGYSGQFVVQIIEGADWDQPLFALRTRNIHEVIEAVARIVRDERTALRR